MFEQTFPCLLATKCVCVCACVSPVHELNDDNELDSWSIILGLLFEAGAWRVSQGDSKSCVSTPFWSTSLLIIQNLTEKKLAECVKESKSEQD